MRCCLYARRGIKGNSLIEIDKGAMGEYGNPFAMTLRRLGEKGFPLVSQLGSDDLHFSETEWEELEHELAVLPILWLRRGPLAD